MRHLVEILSDLDVLKARSLDLETLQMDGVPFGSSTERFPRHKVVEVSLSPIVHRSRGGTGIKTEYFDRDGRCIPLDHVIDSIIGADGMVHFKNKVGYKITAGKVVGFAIYGDHLRRFDDLKTYDDFLRVFGQPDRATTDTAYGDLMGYSNYYYDSRKHVEWDSFDNRVSLINLGAYDGNAPE